MTVPDHPGKDNSEQEQRSCEEQPHVKRTVSPQTRRDHDTSLMIEPKDVGSV